jgi:hypothetical protein
VTIVTTSIHVILLYCIVLYCIVFIDECKIKLEPKTTKVTQTVEKGSTETS